MASGTFNILLFLQITAIVFTQISSRELLKALYDYEEPLLLNEEKSRQIADNMEKRKLPSKVGSGKGQQQLFAQLGVDFTEDDYQEVPTNEFDDTNYQIIDSQRYQDKAKETSKPDQINVEPQDEDDALFKFQTDDSDCADNLPTYRVYMGSKCIPIIPEYEENKSDQEEEKPVLKPEEPKDTSSFNEHLINYLDLDNPYYIDHYGQQHYGSSHEGHSQSGNYQHGNYEQQSGYNTQQQTDFGKESERFGHHEDWDNYQQNSEGQGGYWDRYQQSLTNEQSDAQQQVGNQQYTQQNNQQEYGQQDEQRNSNNYQDSIYGQSQYPQSVLSSDYNDDVNSMDSYWSQHSVGQIHLNPESSIPRKPQQIPISVNTERLSASRGQNQIDGQEQYSQQFYPPQHIIGHRPYPIQVPVDNSVHQQKQQRPIVQENSGYQQQVHRPVIPHIKNKNFSCDGKETGYYADYASDCKKFYRCVVGDYRTFEFSCGVGTKFHPLMHVCVHEKDVDCRENVKLPIMK